MDKIDMHNRYITACSQQPITCVIINTSNKKQSFFGRVFAKPVDISVQVKRDKYTIKLSDGETSAMYRFQIQLLVRDITDPLTRLTLRILSCDSYKVVSGKHILQQGECNVLCSEHVSYVVVDGDRVLMSKDTRYTDDESIIQQVNHRLNIIYRYAQSIINR